MAHEVAVVLLVVVGDDIDSAAAQLRDLRGRELGGVPGSWVSRVAVHADLDAFRDRLRVPAIPPTTAGADAGGLYLPLDLAARAGRDAEEELDREPDEADSDEDDPARPLR